jgi:hypothetical protein
MADFELWTHLTLFVSSFKHTSSFYYVLSWVFLPWNLRGILFFVQRQYGLNHEKQLKYVVQLY